MGTLRRSGAVFFLCLTALGQNTPVTQVHRFALADCDDVAFGPDGDLYFACHSPKDSLPAAVRGSKTSSDEMDAYVLRVRSQTGELVYATRIGGSSFDAALRIAVDAQGHAHATGLTKSMDFPVTSDAQQRDLRGKSDAFLAKIGSSGNILYSTLAGGSGDDLGNGLDIDGGGVVYLGGVTSSTDFGVRAIAKTSKDDDAFICMIQTTKHQTACFAFGGSKTEKLTGVALDRNEGIYAVGVTNSEDFPTKRPLQKTVLGANDLFLTRLTVPSLKVTFSTTFGGGGDDSGWGIATDGHGNPVVSGITNSIDLPGTTGSYQPRKNGKKDAFVTKFQGRHRRNIRTTYLGGSSDDESGYDGGNIKVDRNGNVWLVGTTYSEDFPIRDAAQAQFGGGNGDGFVAAFDAELKRLCFASYFGDKERNLLEGLAVSPTGLVAATGVSFAEAPKESHVQIGNLKLFAGHHVLLLQGSGVCGR